ncbi:placenta growth factor isoform X2 [Lampris incognitus]|nr:placenta growth factor isoform X2 [Lampris incognitus]
MTLNGHARLLGYAFRNPEGRMTDPRLLEVPCQHLFSEVFGLFWRIQFNFICYLFELRGLSLFSTRRLPEMKLSVVIPVVVALQLQLSPAQILPSTSLNTTSEVVMFQEVLGRSFCRTIEKLVEVVQEYPGEVEHIYSPSCVPLVRCAGCCGDENLECQPTQTTNVTMQLLKIKPAEQAEEYVEMTFVEHETCK